MLETVSIISKIKHYLQKYGKICSEQVCASLSSDIFRCLSDAELVVWLVKFQVSLLFGLVFKDLSNGCTYVLYKPNGIMNKKFEINCIYI